MRGKNLAGSGRIWPDLAGEARTSSMASDCANSWRRYLLTYLLTYLTSSMASDCANSWRRSPTAAASVGEPLTPAPPSEPEEGGLLTREGAAAEEARVALSCVSTIRISALSAAPWTAACCCAVLVRREASRSLACRTRITWGPRLVSMRLT